MKLAAIVAAFLCLIFVPARGQSDDSNYKLSPNDLLDFRVFQEPEMDAVLRISGDGSASFPLVGSVHVGGKSVSDAIALLRREYLDGYLANPQISITIREYARRRFTILGQVQKPGSFEITGNEGISILQAIGIAGGYTRIADAANVTVKRREQGKESILKFNAKKMARSDSDSSFIIKPGDVITVGESIF